jgi:hypothetical protein
MTGNHISVPPGPARQCTRCGGLGTHYLTCPILRLPGFRPGTARASARPASCPSIRDASQIVQTRAVVRVVPVVGQHLVISLLQASAGEARGQVAKGQSRPRVPRACPQRRGQRPTAARPDGTFPAGRRASPVSGTHCLPRRRLRCTAFAMWKGSNLTASPKTGRPAGTAACAGSRSAMSWVVTSICLNALPSLRRTTSAASRVPRRTGPVGIEDFTSTSSTM